MKVLRTLIQFSAIASFIFVLPIQAQKKPMVIQDPEVGIKVNTHFPFSDLNSLEVADLMSSWLSEKGFDN
ncbi:hypothetical protein Q2T41_13765 [Maribacter confluentis]|uniref:Uncharacterized protein n=1 Tax=Maribacter confluentis TaxID=1656093 RepID=A0ABT8RS68_9FLAO|nr:hypothetical protein [Maribacter confluentis]MDO1513726.1 hypothetical protein [Maribacter confluentis]